MWVCMCGCRAVEVHGHFALESARPPVCQPLISLLSDSVKPHWALTAARVHPTAHRLPPLQVLRVVNLGISLPIPIPPALRHLTPLGALEATCRAAASMLSSTADATFFARPPPTARQGQTATPVQPQGGAPRVWNPLVVRGDKEAPGSTLLALRPLAPFIPRLVLQGLELVPG